MSDAIGRVCSLCGNTFFGYCNHGTDWSGTYENNFQKMVDAANARSAEVNQKVVGIMMDRIGGDIIAGNIGKPGPIQWAPIPVPKRDAMAAEMVKEIFDGKITFLCNKCQLAFPVFELDRDRIKSCCYCGSLDVQPMPTPAEYFDGHYQPRCAICGESPTAEYLASKPEDWLCCDPVPILLPRRIFSEAA